MRIEQRAKLVARRGLGSDVVIAQPHQALQLAYSGIDGLQAAQSVAIGAQVIGELVQGRRQGSGGSSQGGHCQAPNLTPCSLSAW